MKIKYHLIILIFVSMISCKSNEKVSTTLNTSELEINSIALYRSGCYGTCPSFKISIQKDGSFTYYGKSNVENIGNFYGQLTEEQRTNLFEKLQTLNWSSFPEEYEMDNFDFPQFTIWYNDKTIQANSNADKQLIDLSILLDALTKNLTYLSKE